MQIYEIDKSDFLPIIFESGNNLSFGLLTGKDFMAAQWLCMEITVEGAMIAIYVWNGQRTALLKHNFIWAKPLFLTALQL